MLVSHPITKSHRYENVCRKCLLSISQFSMRHLLLPTTLVTVFTPSFLICYLSHHCWQTSSFGKMRQQTRLSSHWRWLPQETAAPLHATVRGLEGRHTVLHGCPRAVWMYLPPRKVEMKHFISVFYSRESQLDNCTELQCQ